MTNRDVVVIGASAGGVEVLREVAAGLPAQFPAAVLVVLHVPATGTSALPRILDRSGALPAKHAEDGDPLHPGRILVAPPDRHLIVNDAAVTLSAGPRENGHRPAVDVLFRSAAAALGPRVVAVVLSGALDDGAAGMVAVRLRGGLGIVQDPKEALHPGMPSSALRAAAAEHVVPAAKLADLLCAVVEQEVVHDHENDASDLMRMETALADFDVAALNQVDRPGVPAGLSCPDCHGTLFEIVEGGLTRYRCRIGHAWSGSSLLASQTSEVEEALSMALRTLEEKAALNRQLGDQAVGSGHRIAGADFHSYAEEALRAAAMVRDLIEDIAGKLSAERPEALQES